MSIFSDSKQLFSLAQAEGRVVKLRKLIQLDHESLDRPDSFLNRHEKVEARLDRYYVELNEAEKSLYEFLLEE